MAVVENYPRSTETKWLRISTVGRPIGVDRENEVIRGAIMAQEGVFKDRRGEFSQAALEETVKLVKAAPNGLKARMSHPDESHDGIGKFLGRWRDPWLDVVTLRDSEGTLKTDPIRVVRADLYIDKSSHSTPGGDLGKYVLDLIESDSDALSSSLVVKPNVEPKMDKYGLPQRGEDGAEVPPLWTPLEIHACDIVDTGDAVDGLLSAALSASELPNGVLYKAAEMLNEHFAGKDEGFVAEHCLAWLDRYLSRRYGLAAPEEDQPADDPARHDGCRSARGLHYEKQCRQCGSIISSCGCKDRHRESRVIRMGTCKACEEKASKSTEEPEPEGSLASIPLTVDATLSVDLHTEPTEDQSRRQMELTLLELER